MYYIFPLVFISGCLLGLSGFVEKYYIFKKINPFQLFIFRNIFISILLLLYSFFYYLYNKKNLLLVDNEKKIDTKFKLLLIFYCICYLFVILNIFNGFNNKKAYKISFTIQMSILISAFIFSYFIFKEEFNIYNIFGVLLSLISIILILC